MIDNTHTVEGSPEDHELEIRLRATMDRIEAILKEDDCAALVIIAKPGGARVRITMDTTWSCATVTQDGAFIMAAVAVPEAKRAKVVAETGNALASIADLTAQAGVELLTASEYINQTYGLTHVCMGQMNPPVKH